MGAVADLGYVGAPVNDPEGVARFIAGMVLTKRQKATLLKDYLREQGLTLSEGVRRAADPYAEAL